MTFELHPRLEADSVHVGSLPLSEVRLIRDARYAWVLLVPRRPDVKDAHELSDEDQAQLTRESAQLCRAMMTLFQPFKMNVAALGNMVPQLHVHHIARSPGDHAWPGPVWGVGEARAYDAQALTERVQVLKAALGL